MMKKMERSYYLFSFILIFECSIKNVITMLKTGYYLFVILDFHFYLFSPSPLPSINAMLKEFSYLTFYRFTKYIFLPAICLMCSPIIILIFLHNKSFLLYFLKRDFTCVMHFYRFEFFTF